MKESYKPILAVVSALLLYVILFIVFLIIARSWWFPDRSASAEPYELFVIMIVSLIAFALLLYVIPLILSRWFPKLSLKQKQASSRNKTASKTDWFQKKHTKLNLLLTLLVIVPLSLLLFFLLWLYLMSMFAPF
jgi:hypothetical protein